MSTAHNRWRQFEEFPPFMEGVREVKQLDDRTLRWRLELAGKEWEAEIVRQTPDEIISCRSTSGAMNNGTVTFHPIEPDRTRERDGRLARRDQGRDGAEGLGQFSGSSTQKRAT